jgi:SAM-dependent methyltransferase
MSLHARFSTADEPWPQWLFDREAPGPDARVLEVGCGPGAFWESNRDRIDPTWKLTLTDLSPGMVETAQRVLGNRARFLVADVQELPFPDETFDVVLANHMLYHVPDRPKAFAEIARVLVPGGVLHAATNGRGHLRQLDELVGPDWEVARVAEAFGLESGAAQLEAFFVDVMCERHGNALAVTDAEAAVAYVASSETFRGDIARVRRAVEEAIGRDGVLRVDSDAGVLHGRKARAGRR